MFKILASITALTLIVPIITSSDDSLNLSNIPHGDYCKIRWNHVMCYYGPELGKDCAGEVVDVPMTNRERHLILLQHNLFRDKVAGGSLQIGEAFGTSGEMFELTWNYELEMFAQRWADQCIPYEYDSNRDTFEMNVKQNVYSACFYNHYDLTTDYIFKLWGEDQMKNVSNKAWKGQSQRFYPEVTQVINMVWHTTKYIGCARRLMKTSNRPEYRIYFVCNYGPAGDYRGRRPYRHSSRGPCTNCLCLHPYPNLCVAGSPINSMIIGRSKHLDREENVLSGANSIGFPVFLTTFPLICHAVM